MKHIDKATIRATKYRAELEAFEQSNDGNHPDFSNSAFRRRFYQDVYMNLLYCQDGLCAYTESLICSNDDDIFNEETWENGEYGGNLETKNLEGNIDHFNPALKQVKGWEWSNLFVVSASINQKVKRKEEIPVYLKPDHESYSPYEFLQYNFDSHRYVPHPRLEEATTKDVWGMIDNLGLNFHTIKERRKKLLSEKALYIGEGVKSFEEVLANEIWEFFTAFEMSRDDLEGFRIEGMYFGD